MAGREHLENVESGYLAALAQANVLSAWINLPTFVKRHSRTLAQACAISQGPLMGY